MSLDFEFIELLTNSALMTETHSEFNLKEARCELRLFGTEFGLDEEKWILFEFP